MQGSESQQHVAIERASASLPCKLLIGGKGEVGQAPLAAALLQVVQEAPLHLLSLPVLVVEGEGDAALGCVRLLAEAFRRATTSQPIVLFLPRLDAWAVSRVVADPDEVDEAETVECQQPPALPTTSPFRGLLPIGARGSLVDEPMASPRRAEAHREAVVHAGQPTSPRHLTQQQQATKRALVKGCYQGTTADKDGVSTPGVEISVLSDVWNVFEQVLKQASSSQPILVLATTNMDPISLPPALLSFFGGQAAVDGCVGGDGQTAAGSGQPSSMVMLGSSSPEAWREAMAAALDLASEAIANTLTPEGHRDASKRHRSHLPEQAERSAPLRPAAGVQRAEPWAVMNSGLATAPDYNENELREGVQLHERVVTAICLVSQRLWSDPRARAVSAAQASAGAPVDGREERESLLDVTKRAIAGGYNSLEEFQQAVQLTAEAVRRARGSGSRGHGGGNNEGRGHSTRAAAASALADEVVLDKQCYKRYELELNNRAFLS
ncbi:hypothetical protein WJX72_000093 [[Myrmecia] bisecta]|uniref:Uncharacterized protein n=1 Tax=[Myrmecia] bisecta TaxID=41462 RepID=A0AAW1Q003_9CHLO